MAKELPPPSGRTLPTELGPVPRRGFWSAVFCFPAMISVGLCLITLLTVRGRFYDPDAWWHLRVGEVIWRSHSIPRFDEFSFTTNHHSWLPHEWLAQVTIYAAYELGGYRGMWAWLFVLASLLFVSVYGLCSIYSGNAKVALLGGLVAWFFGTAGLAVRPLILGHLFLVAELWILQLARSRSRAWLWTLPPLFAVWVNCHGSYILGLLALAVAASCSFVSLHVGLLVSERRDVQERRLLVLMLVLCLAALMLNPIGPKLLTYPIDTFAHQSETLASTQEWQALDINEPRGVGFFAMAGVFALIFLVRPAEIRLEELLLLAIGFGMAIQHARLLFAFGILTAPVLCRLLADAWDRYEPSRDNRVANAVLMLACIALMWSAFPRRGALLKQVRDHSPVAAVEFIRQSRLSGPMLNEFEWGGYLIWALPEQRVFIDGRADVFEWAGVLREYGRWAQLQEDPRLLLDKYHVQYCLLRSAAPMASVLPYLPGWKKVYNDPIAVIFVRS